METCWLQNLKPGDDVAVAGNGVPCISQVFRVTPKQVEVCSFGKYWKDGGSPVGYGRTCLIEPTQEVRDDFERELLANKFYREINPHSLSLVQLRGIYAIAQQPKE